MEADFVNLFTSSSVTSSYHVWWFWYLFQGYFLLFGDFLRGAECSQLWFVNTLDLILFWFKKAWGELSFSANDKPNFYPTPTAAASGKPLLQSGQGHNNFARRIALLGENWSLRLARRKYSLLWLWLGWLLTAGQIFVIFLRAVEGFEVPQITCLQCTQVRSTLSDLSGWVKDYLLVHFIGKSLTLTPAH